MTTKFLVRTKVVAYADDLLIATRGKSVRGGEFCEFGAKKNREMVQEKLD